ncbi:MAG: NAD(P)/FAD-dependent oxidoreductase [Actinomycetota bacterium]
MTTGHVDSDVAIVGAGATGLTAAWDLVRAGHGVTVLEARDRVGGRLWTNHIDGQLLEVGGQWVSPDQHALLAMLDELGLETYERYRTGSSVYIGPGGVPARFTGDIFPAADATRAEIERLIGVIDGLTSEIDASAPWSHPRAREFDTISFSAWLESESSDSEARANIALYIAEAMLTKPAHSFSLLQALLMAASAGSFAHLVDADYILDRRVIGGLQSVPLELARRLGDSVHLGEPVLAIDWTQAGAMVRTATTTVKARRVLVATPPNLHERIAYRPSLPRLRRQLDQHLSLGLVIKVHATYDTPFWREDGLSGTAFSPWQVVHEAYDNTNHGEEQGTLVGIVSDEKADAVFAETPERRRRVILESLAAYFGPKALEPRVYYESDWAAEEWTGGAYAASFDLGGLTRFGPHQLDPVGPIRFASSDLAGLGYQHVDGAIRMGHDAAAAIIHSLD